MRKQQNIHQDPGVTSHLCMILCPGSAPVTSLLWEGGRIYHEDAEAAFVRLGDFFDHFLCLGSQGLQQEQAEEHLKSMPMWLEGVQSSVWHFSVTQSPSSPAQQLKPSIK